MRLNTAVLILSLPMLSGWTISGATFKGVQLGENSPVVVSDTIFDNSSDAASSEALTAVRLPRQRCSFYANGRYWVFYGDYSDYNVKFKTSTDGTSWSSATTAFSFPVVDAQWTVIFDGTYIHYGANISQQAQGNPHEGLKYRRGTPEIDGSITWSAAEQTAVANTTGCSDLSMAIDSLGNPWFGYAKDDLTPNVTASSTADGTWTTAAGFPHELDAVAKKFTIIEPLSNGQMYAVVYEWVDAGTDNPADGYFWNGSDWVSEGEITNESVEIASGSTGEALVARIQATGDGGIVHLVYQSSDGDLIYKQRSSSGSWSDEFVFEDQFVSPQSSPTITISSDGVFICWDVPGYSAVFIKHRDSSGNWGPRRIIETSDAVHSEYAHLQSSRETMNSNIGLAYLTEALDIRFILATVE
jgi:hypothetical protein